MNPLSLFAKGRFALYLAGAAAGFMALSGYATFDPETWLLDIHPFNLKEFVLTVATTGGNAVAAVAVYTGLKSR